EEERSFFFVAVASRMSGNNNDGGGAAAAISAEGAGSEPGGGGGGSSSARQQVDVSSVLKGLELGVWEIPLANIRFTEHCRQRSPAAVAAIVASIKGMGWME
ncbi:unnamed protein product, partial [Ectocarpus fasciculatus]